MKLAAFFGLMAMVPASFSGSLASASTLVVPICTGDGQVRTAKIPAEGSQLPGGKNAPCCVKGCHSGSSRKRHCR